jgi:hypothetical protein
MDIPRKISTAMKMSGLLGSDRALVIVRLPVQIGPLHAETVSNTENWRHKHE